MIMRRGLLEGRVVQRGELHPSANGVALVFPQATFHSFDTEISPAISPAIERVHLRVGVDIPNALNVAN